MPLFWRLLGGLPALELVCHRVIWSTLFLSILIPLLRWIGGPVCRELAGPPGVSLVASPQRAPQRRWSAWLITVAAALVIAVNWLSFVWAVTNDQVLNASLGYYISPLLSVALGVLAMRERLSRGQWVAIVMAGLGVGTITASSGGVPWSAVGMAVSFAVYGLLKKNVRLPALVGLWLESTIIALPAVIYLGLMPPRGDSAVVSFSSVQHALLMLGGLVTIPPLMLFAIAARRIPLATIGILQYISPTMQFLLGVGVAGERLAAGGLVGFVLVWLGSACYMLTANRSNRRPVAAELVD